MLGKSPCTLQDLAQVDEQLFNSLLWVSENCVTDVLDETFSIIVPEQIPTRDHGQQHDQEAQGRYKQEEQALEGEVVDLVERGSQKTVTDENKHEYINLRVQWRTEFCIQQELHAFLAGLHEIVPVECLTSFATHEMDRLLNGQDPVHVDVDEVRAFASYTGGFTDSDPTVLWLWTAWRNFQTGPEASKLLVFISGASRVPLDGFSPPLTITFGSDMELDALPKAHTCFNQLVLPRYSSYQSLHSKLSFAIANCTGFELT